MAWPNSRADRQAHRGRAPESGPSASDQDCSRRFRGICRNRLCRTLRDRVGRSYGQMRKGGDEAISTKSEILLEFTAPDFARDALDVIEAVEGAADTTQSNQTARFEHLAVARDVE